MNGRDHNRFNNFIEDIKNEILTEYKGFGNFLSRINDSFTKVKNRHLTSTRNTYSSLPIEDKIRAFDIALEHLLINPNVTKNNGMIKDIEENLKDNISRDDRKILLKNKSYLSQGINLPSINIDMNINKEDYLNGECPICLSDVSENEVRWNCSFCVCNLHFKCGNDYFISNSGCPICKAKDNFLILKTSENSSFLSLLEFTIKYCALYIFEKEHKNFTGNRNISFVKKFPKEFTSLYGFDSMHINIDLDDSEAIIFLSLAGELYIHFKYNPFSRDENELKSLLNRIKDTPFINLLNYVIKN